MSFSVRRKRNPRDLRCILFPEDRKDTRRNISNETKVQASSSHKSWQRCGDAFLDTPVSKKPKTPGPKLATLRQSLLQTSAEKKNGDTEEPVHIAWSSSESENSDCEESNPSRKTSELVPKQSRPNKSTQVDPKKLSSHLPYLRNEPDDLPAIESDSDQHEDEEDYVNDVRDGGRKEREPDDPVTISDFKSPEKAKTEEIKENTNVKGTQRVPDVDITDYASDEEGDNPAGETSLNVSVCESIDPVEGGRGRSLSDWIRSEQALLQTPQKQASCHFKTPDDSNKKRKKFERGGLAERLNRLQARQRSAISFWRHQSTAPTTTATAGKAGVLALRILLVKEDCGLRVSLCQRLQDAPSAGHRDPAEEPLESAAPAAAAAAAEGGEQGGGHGESDHCLVLFRRETANQLAPCPGDLVHVHPPWQTLVIEGESRPVILNAHFSQRVVTPGRQGSSSLAPGPPWPSSLVQRCLPHPLGRSWGQWLEEQRAPPPAERGSDSSRQAGVCERVQPQASGVCDSLLEAVERLGSGGYLGLRLEVVIQRVYCISIPQPSPERLPSLRRSPYQRSPRSSTTSSSANSAGRLCVLVQDAWGMLSEVQLQALGSEEQLELLGQQWEGRPCVLQRVKVLQRVTRHRCTALFNLIDSLWPPTLPLRVHAGCEEGRTRAAAPNFCYCLSGSEASVLVSQESLSPLYQPPRTQSLREILQDGKEGSRCSFKASVVFRSFENSGAEAGGAESCLLFVTDASLQGEEDLPPPPRRTLPVCLSPFFMLQHSVRQAISSPAPAASSSSSSSCYITFRDVVLQRGCMVCLEQSLVKIATEPSAAERLPTDLLLLPRPVLLDQLGPDTAPNTLCTLSGVIVGVDEDTAYSWPVCSLCESDHLERALANWQGFVCRACRTEVIKPIIRMQLEVFLNGLSMTDCTIKIKLQQKTINTLLGSDGRDSEFHEVESLLGKEVGPLSAYVRVITRTSGLWGSLEEVNL
ncbi:DNA repair-scaffolding protein isoform X3 [Engraulis encrasicolus]|uniref:DNA repair-scaffolding protein isoform X3 n=1 Tax=Engraulis encrasicolus TaxID=184585 RepID=UPI002FD137AF